MKKVLALALAAAMTLSLVACGNKPEEPKQTESQKTETKDQSKETTGGSDEIVFEGEMDFAWWGSQYRTDITTAALDLYVEKHPEVSFNTMPYSWNDYWTILATASTGNSLPDLIQQDYVYIQQFVDAGDLLDLNPYIESGALDVSGISEQILETGTVDGHVYALCAGVNAPSLIYDKTLTDSLGIEVPDCPTWDEFVEISKKIYAETGTRTSYMYGASENPLSYYIRSKGYTQFFDTDKLFYDDASVMEEYYQRMVDGVKDGWLMDGEAYGTVDTTSIEQNPMIYYSNNSLRSWCSASFSNQVAAFVQNAPEGVELAICAWPADKPADSNYMKPSQFFAITTDTENPDLAVDILNFLINDVDANKAMAAERGIPASSVVADAIAPSLDETQQMVIKYLNEVVAENSSAIFPPLVAKTAEVINGPIKEIAEKVLYGQMDAKAAAEELFTRANEIMGQ